MEDDNERAAFVKRQPAGTINPRVKLHENGNVTVSGIPYDRLRSILTEAILYRYEHKVVPEDETADQYGGVARNNKHALDWERQMFWYLRSLTSSLDAAILSSLEPDPPVDRKTRLKAWWEERKIGKELFKKAIAARMAQRQKEKNQ